MRWYTERTDGGRTDGSQGPLPDCVPKIYAKRDARSLIRRANYPRVFTFWVIGSVVVWSAVTGLVWLYYA
jgi:hypothetical protein